MITVVMIMVVTMTAVMVVMVIVMMFDVGRINDDDDAGWWANGRYEFV